jgi:hypothetical protein
LKLACIIFNIYKKKEAQNTSLKWLIEVFIKSVSPPHTTWRLVLAARMQGGGAPVYLVFFVDLNAASLDFESVVCCFEYK